MSKSLKFCEIESTLDGERILVIFEHLMLTNIKKILANVALMNV